MSTFAGKPEHENTSKNWTADKIRGIIFLESFLLEHLLLFFSYIWQQHLKYSHAGAKSNGIYALYLQLDIIDDLYKRRKARITLLQ